MTQTARGAPLPYAATPPSGLPAPQVRPKTQSRTAASPSKAGKHATVSALFVCQSWLSSIELQCSP